MRSVFLNLSYICHGNSKRDIKYFFNCGILSWCSTVQMIFYFSLPPLSPYFTWHPLISNMYFFKLPELGLQTLKSLWSMYCLFNLLKCSQMLRYCTMVNDIGLLWRKGIILACRSAYCHDRVYDRSYFWGLKVQKQDSKGFCLWIESILQ